MEVLVYQVTQGVVFFGSSRVQQISHEFGIEYQVCVGLQTPEVQVTPYPLNTVYC